jgi:hypothetical protein
MKLFETIKEMGHEQVFFCHDKEQDLRAIIAIHDTGLGAAMGATRLWLYASEEDALRDVLRLSRGMTYKAACANIPVVVEKRNRLLINKFKDCFLVLLREKLLVKKDILFNC